MTTPGGAAPDGAYVIGTEFGQDQNETTVRAAIRQPVINPWSLAQFNWRDLFLEKFDTVANLKDGQNAYKDRLDLLNQVSGHGSTVMGQNWQVPLNKWCAVPFTVQVGPMKRTGLDTANGRVSLKAGGLWRVDALMNCLGYTVHFTPGFTIGGITYPPYWTYNPLSVSYLIEVVSAAGMVLTAREFKAQVGGQPNEVKYSPIPPDLPSSSAFSHTFVLENMPGQDTESGATGGWAYARLRMYASGTTSVFTNSHCAIYGGTKTSGLTASRWSRDAVNIVNQPTVPDGGVLT